MESTEQNTEQTSAAPNYYYNYGYALLVGVKDFNGNYQTPSKNLNGAWGPLPYTKNSLDYISNLLYKVKSGVIYKDYQDVIKLYNNDAIFVNVIKSILYFAKNLKAGETFVITFATHGIMLKRTYGSGRINTMMLSDTYITEDELYYLMKFFKEDTRIFIIFDCCHSGSFLNWQPNNLVEQLDCLNAFCDRIELYDQDLGVGLREQIWEMIDSELQATIYVYGVTSDFNEVSDIYNGSFFMYQTAKTWNGYDLIIDNFVLRNQAKVKSFIRGYIEEIEDINVELNGDNLVAIGKKYWKSMYCVVYYHLFKMNVDINKVPDYNPNSSNHRFVLSKILPSLKKIGKNHSKYDSYKLFCVSN